MKLATLGALASREARMGVGLWEIVTLMICLGTFLLPVGVYLAVRVAMSRSKD